MLKRLPWYLCVFVLMASTWSVAMHTSRSVEGWLWLTFIVCAGTFYLELCQAFDNDGGS